MPGDDSTGLDAALEALITREPRPVVVRLARRPGQKEPRYAHLLAGDVAEPAEEAPLQAQATSTAAERITTLEEQVQELRNEVNDLRAQLAAFRKQFE
jgi:uncharacterized protein YceH (UPF0502 family)